MLISRQALVGRRESQSRIAQMTRKTNATKQLGGGGQAELSRPLKRYVGETETMESKHFATILV
jgi:hypothetical protein